MKKPPFILALFMCLSLFSCKKEKQELTNAVITPNNFLSEEKYKKLIIEIDQVAGFEPSPETIQNVVFFLQNRIHKSDGIEVILNTIPAKNVSAYNLVDIQNLERQHRGQGTSGS